MKVNSQILIVALLMVLCLNLSRIYAQPYSISSTEIIIFRDGVAQVIQSLDVDESLVSISIPLLSHSVWNLLVLDEDNMPLSYTIKLPNITITTLGASKVTLDYFTPTLTQKEGEVWTIKLNLPYEVKIILPERSNIIYLNDLPSSITARDQRIVLTVPPGFWEISYVLPPMIPLPPSTLPPTP
ncbi:MAG: hypothetical protein N3F06_02515, partial [Nitrososphaerales archaeon]|nr:hypothetical protein [Nitrososphaerales archaeon]